MNKETGEQIERLTAEARASTVTIDGVVYPTTPTYNPRKSEPEPKAIILNTLQSFADFVKSDLDEPYHSPRGLFVHVASPDEINLCTGIFGSFNQRVILAAAEFNADTFAFGRFMDPERFVIGLQCLFEPLDDRETVFKIVGNLQAEESVKTLDDGMSQEAVAKRGVSKLVKVEVPNPVELRPYRTFSEIQPQPLSPFVLRLRGGGGGQLPEAALYECDGGRWRLDAIKAIKEWLEGESLGIEIFG